MKILAAVTMGMIMGVSSARRNVDFTDDLDSRFIPGTFSRIIGGTNVELGRFPFMAGLETNRDGNYCGGSLIAPNVVLSAAHCDVIQAERVFIGCRDRKASELTEENCERFNVIRQFKFPGFDPVKTAGDYMLVVFDGESQNEPVTLAGPTSVGFEIANFQQLTVIGHGVTSTLFGTTSDILKQVDVEVIDQEHCNQQYRSAWSDVTGTINNIPPKVVTDNMICAARPGKDSCQGDSGGPIFLRCEETGEDVQIGIVSWGFGCAQGGLPGVYARISDEAGFDFINRNVELLGHELKVLPSFEDFCVVNGTQPPVPVIPNPTSFPTVSFSTGPAKIPFGWLCNDDYFNANDGCDCLCGLPDPDCEDRNPSVFGCLSADDKCVNGLCVSPVPKAPKQWRCDDKHYGSGDGCDCDCGIEDPDCNTQDEIFGCLVVGAQCIEGRCFENGTFSPALPPLVDDAVIYGSAGGIALFLVIVVSAVVARRRRKSAAQAEIQKARELYQTPFPQATTQMAMETSNFAGQNAPVASVVQEEHSI